jgi:shikimate dehydrogenase
MSILTLKALRQTAIEASLDRVYTLTQVSERSWDGPVCAVLGDPIAHSLSPKLYQAAFEFLAKTHPEYALWRYIKVHVRPDELQLALSILHARGFRGLNLTLPHKVEALKFIVNRTERATRIGSINTLAFQPSGYQGDNTDAFGFLWALKDAFKNVWTPELPVTIVGAGGCARAITEAFLQEGVKKIFICNRSPERLEHFNANFIFQGVDAKRLIVSTIESAPPEGLWVNATPLGLNPTDSLPFPLERLKPDTLIFDVVYAPSGTKLSQMALQKGFASVDGKPMLAAQAAGAFAQWTGHSLDPSIFMAGLKSH